MYVRLGFAIAAHVNPDILIADEVLAVGDEGFRKRCLGQMATSANANRTVILVSHDIRAVQSLCTRVWLMEKGEIVFDGPTLEGIERYQKSSTIPGHRTLPICAHGAIATAMAAAAFIAVEFEDQDQVGRTELKMGESVTIKMKVHFARILHSPEISIAIFDTQGNALFSSKLSDSQSLKDRQPGYANFSVEIPPVLMPGDYLVTLSIWRNSEMFDVIHRIPAFTITPIAASEQFLPDQRWGKLFFRLPWSEYDAAGN